MPTYGKWWKKGKRYFVYCYTSVSGKKYRIKFTATENDWERKG